MNFAKGRRGFRSSRFDMNICEDMNVTHTCPDCKYAFKCLHTWPAKFKLLRVGFILMLQTVMRLKPGKGLLFCGPPCNSHVWMSSGTTKKSKSNPRGDVTVEACKAGNMIAARTACAILVAVMRGCYWALEQPGSSVLPFLAPIRHALDKPYSMGLQLAFFVRLFLVCYRLCVSPGQVCYPGCVPFLSWMGLLGSRTLKRSLLIGSACLVIITLTHVRLVQIPGHAIAPKHTMKNEALGSEAIYGCPGQGERQATLSMELRGGLQDHENANREEKRVAALHPVVHAWFQRDHYRVFKELYHGLGVERPSSRKRAHTHTISVDMWPPNMQRS